MNLNSKVTADRVYVATLLLFLAFSVFVLVNSFQYDFQAQMVPVVLSIPTILLITGVLVYTRFFKSREVPGQGEEDAETREPRPAPESAADIEQILPETEYHFGEVMKVTGWVLSFVLLLYALGFLAAMMIFLFAFFYFHTRSVLKAAVSSIPVAWFLFYFFDSVMGLWLWEGVL